METVFFSCCFLIIIHLVVTSGDQLLHSVAGEVGRGNYTYYSLMYEGPITLYLYSKLGDADLYVSQTVSKPTFEPETYCLQSSTCGLDVIHIPRSFSRPIGIGLYGHISHEVSLYLLEVFYREGDDEADNYDPYTTELKQNKQQEEDAGKEKGWQTSELYSAKEKSASLNLLCASLHNCTCVNAKMVI
ncbi:UPF0669 protein v1g209471-like [Zootermopsis nevadensis]|uniref:UPF0669 protein v1g209471-like n=1 Tax=Zootermopsis nevadensis TaxID=136037 RepID=UPI000B8ED9B1|nr:UPF0669 protein v1g209471-like [Zootermopsis nevadensis]